MRTEDLIADLASRATPLRPLPSPGTRAVGWFVVAIVSAGAGVAVFGARPDIDALVAQSDFIWTGLLALSTALLGVWTALVLAIPGAERSPGQRMTMLGVVALWVGTLVTTMVLAGRGFAGASDWYVCFIRVIAIGLVPAVVLFGMIRRSAPLRLGWTSAVAFAAAMATGGLAIQFICPIDDAAHALLGHLGPVVVLAAAGALTARLLLKRPPDYNRSS